MRKYAYGQQPADIGDRAFGMGWLAGVRHLKMSSASGSFWHVHKEIQFLYCIKGEFGYEFESHEPSVLTAGHYIVIPPGLRHRHVQAIDPAGHRVELFVRSAGGKGPYSPFPPSVAKSLAAALLRAPCRPIAVSRDLGKAFLALDSLAARGERALAPAELALARTLAALAFQRCAEPGRDTAPKRQDGRLMDEAVTWLERHAGEPVRMDRLVDYMGYSRSRLFDLFRKHTGLSPADYLARFRIRMARGLLASTDRKVSDIARACGFAGPQYFNAAFRRQTGDTPSGWRKRSRRDGE
jgi:AraC-like DNA-binding protein